MSDATSSEGRRRSSLVGRVRERSVLRHFVDEAAEGRPALVVLTGVPGAGKTALVRWLRDELRADGVLTAAASGAESSLPFAAIARLCVDLPEVRHLVRTARVDETEAAAGHLDPVAVAFAETIVARARRRLVVLLLDDADDLESASEAVLTHLLFTVEDVAAQSELRLLVVLAAREARGLPGRATRFEIGRNVEIGGLGEEEVFELIARSGLTPSSQIVAELLQDTSGLPLLLQAEIDRQLRAEHREARAPEADQGGRVRSVVDAVRVRLDLVDPADRPILVHAAVLGDPWDPAEVARVAGVDPDLVDEVLGRAEHALLVQRVAGGLEFSHPLVRSQLLAGLTTAELQAVQYDVAMRLLVDPGDDDLVVRSALHLLRAGPLAPDEALAHRCGEAGDLARGWGAWQHASRLLAASVDAHARLGAPADAQASRFLEAGRVAYLDHDPDASERRLRRAVALALEVARPDVAVDAGMLLVRTRLGERPLDRGRRPDTSELEAARAMAGLDPALAVGADAMLAQARYSAGDIDGGADLAEVARAHAGALEPGSGLDALIRLEFADGLLRLAQADLVGAESCFGQAVRHAAAAGDDLLELASTCRLAMLRLVRGELLPAAEELERIERRAHDGRFWGEAGFAGALRGFAATLAGEAGAADQVAASDRLRQRSGHAYTAMVVAPAAAALAARTGSEVRMNDSDPNVYLSASTIVALGAVDAGDVVAARSVVLTARWRHGLRGPVSMDNLAIPIALVEVGDLLDDPDLIALGRAPLEVVHEAGVVIPLAWPVTIPRLLGTAARHAGDLGRARSYLDHALAVAERQRLRPEQARVLFEMARVGADSDQPIHDVEALLYDAIRRFDELSMHGWAARCEATARLLGASAPVGGREVIRQRAILTTDIVGSTSTNARLGDLVYVEQLHVHDRLLRQRVREFGGTEIKHTGDGLNVIFDGPEAALRCAAAAQHDVVAWREVEPDLALSIRCGVAWGRLVPVGADFFGLVQAEAARLCALADRDQVLTSASAADAVAASDLRVEARGPHSLRGFPEPVEVFALSAD